MGLRVAIDLDGTVADLSRAMYDVAVAKGFRASRSGVGDPTPAGPPDRPMLTDLALQPSELDALWNHVLRIKDFWATLDETEAGIVARIAALAADRRWDVLFITTRPTSTGATTQVQSQQWLSARGFPMPSVYVVKGSRGKVAAALHLDAVVDDRPENCLDVAIESTARAVLVWAGSREVLGPGPARRGVLVTSSTGAALDELMAMDRSRRGGIGRSLKRLLGRH